MNLPNLHLSKRTKIILLSLLAVALLGGIFYGGYTAGRSSASPVSPTAELPGNSAEVKQTQTATCAPVIVESSRLGWKKIINACDGYSIEYPAEYSVEFPLEESRTQYVPDYREVDIGITAPVVDYLNYTGKVTPIISVHISITARDNPDFLSAAEWFKSKYPSENTGWPHVLAGTETTYAGYEAYVANMALPDTNEEWVVIVNDDVAYTISYYKRGVDNPNDELDYQRSIKIANAFEILESIEIVE